MGVDSLLRNAVVGIVGAVIAVVVVFLIADAASGPLLATQPGGDAPEEVPLGGAVFGTVVGGVVGAVIAFLSARTSRSVETFIGICVVALILYGLFAFSAADGSATGIWLNVMHLAAAAPIVGLLARWLRTHEPNPA